MKNTIFQLILLLVALGTHLPSLAQTSGGENSRLSNNSLPPTGVSTTGADGEISTTLYPVCESYLNIRYNISGLNRILKTSNLIVASNNISNGANVTYSAKNTVVLIPGFDVYRGSRFVAVLGGCEPHSRREGQSNTLAVGPDGLPLDGQQANSNTSSEQSRKHREGIINELMFSVAPNPFSDKTTLSYQLVRDEKVTLDIYTMDARHIKSLINEPNQRIGNYQVTLDASTLPSGMYYAILRHGGQQTMKKIVINK